MRTFIRAWRLLVGGLLVAALSSASFPAASEGGELIAGTTDKGWYFDSGFHEPTNQNYIVGKETDLFPGGGVYRNFFVFNLPPSSGAVLSAELRLFNPANGYASDYDSETFRPSRCTTCPPRSRPSRSAARG